MASTTMAIAGPAPKTMKTGSAPAKARSHASEFISRVPVCGDD